MAPLDQCRYSHYLPFNMCLTPGPVKKQINVETYFFKMNKETWSVSPNNYNCEWNDKNKYQYQHQEGKLHTKSCEIVSWEYSPHRPTDRAKHSCI